MGEKTERDGHQSVGASVAVYLGSPPPVPVEEVCWNPYFNVGGLGRPDQTLDGASDGVWAR